MKQLTPRQQQIYDLIRTAIQETGIPPTRIEIAQKFGFRSANAAEEHLKALAKKGFIEMKPGTSRGIKLLQSIPPLDTLPLIGHVAAGEPILAEQHIESHYHVDPTIFKPNADFLLRVRGMSMKDIGILDGDLLAVHKTQEIHNGQIVVARIHDEVTVKRWRKEGDHVYLIAENETFSPITLNLRHDSIAIEGLAVGVIRSNVSW